VTTLTKVKLADFLKPYRITHIVQDNQTYGQVTISKKHTVSFRGKKSGSKIGRKRQFIIDLEKHPNTVLFTRQGINDGAIGLAPQEVDKCIATENMPMMSVNTDIIEVDYLKKLLISDYLFEKIHLLKVVGSAQKSIHERDFLKIQILLPSKETQRILCKKLNLLDKEFSTLISELTHQSALLKKLRQRILQEAIEGKLTAEWRTENPDVEPARELLEKIKAEKAQLIKEKKIRKQKPLPPISAEEKPFELPEGWAWCRLGDTAQSITSGSRGWAKYYTDKGALFLTMGNLSKDSYELRLNKLRYVNPPKNSEGARTKLQTGDLLISVTGDVGNLGLIPDGFGEAYINQHTCMLRFMPECRNLFFPELMRSPLAKQQFNAPQRGIKNSFRLSDVGEMIIPFPPLAEQKAIVSKVKKLLSLCDQLETQINENKLHAEKLIQSVLREAFAHPAR